jgi:hypothetical protein
MPEPAKNAGAARINPAAAECVPRGLSGFDDVCANAGIIFDHEHNFS